MTNIRILVQEGMKKALRLSKKPSLSKRDVKTILKAVASQARRIKKMDDELPFGAETPGFKDKSRAERKGMEAKYNALRRNIASLGAPFPEGGEPAALVKRDAFSRRGFDTTYHRSRRIRAGYPETPVSGREEMSGMQAFPDGGMEISNLPDLPGSPGTLNKALKDLPDKVGRTVYDPIPFGPGGGPLQPDKKLTARMRGLEGLMKKYSQTSAGYPTRKMAAELEAYKKINTLKDVQNYMKRLKQKKKLREKLPNALVPPLIQLPEGVNNPKDGADVQLNHQLERRNRLLDSMKRQNRQAKQEMMKKYGLPFKPTKPQTGVINFRAEAVEARYKRLKKARDKKIAKDPRVGLHGPSHPMFHRTDLAKRVRQLALQIKNKSRGKLNG